MSVSIDRAYEAFESALRHAPLGGLRDLHEALQTGQLAVHRLGKAALRRGSWGTIGRRRSARAENATACPLTALYVSQAVESGGPVSRTTCMAAKAMSLDGFTPQDFYAAWDLGWLRVADLRARVERHLEKRSL